MKRLIIQTALAAMLGGATCAHAQQQQPEPVPATPPAQPAGEEQEKKDSALPDLDELLGIEPDPSLKGDRAGDAIGAEQGELERKLTAQEASEKFQQAIAQMSETAVRIEQSRDLGVVTQRLQEEIITKLDVLIKHAQQQGGGGGGSSNSSSSSQAQQSTPSQPQAPQDGEQGEGQDPSGAASGGGDPAFREGKNPMLQAASAAWGRLPERVRDTLLQGLNDQYSARYKAQTEEYYRRLAEEANEQ